VHERTVYRIIELLERAGVVECVNESYSFTQRKRSKEYVFVGAPPVGEKVGSAA
jgi:hypothetical protein